GVIAGSFDDSDHPGHGYVRAANGSITTFDPPGSTGAFVSSINDRGTATGDYIDGNVLGHGFLRAADGIITSFDAPGALYFTVGFCINNKGVIAGEYEDNEDLM